MSTAVTDAHGVRRRGQLYVALAAVAWSSAGVIQRELSVGVATQVAGRALFAALALLVFVAVTERGRTVRTFTSMGLAEGGVVVFAAISSGAFIIALNYTTVANVLFLQAVAPIAAALIAWVALREPISLRTAMAMVVAMAGVALMVGGPGGAQGLGLVLSVVMTLSFALLVVITRHRRDISMAPAISLSQVLVFAVLAPFAEPGSIDVHDLVLLAALGIGQMGLASSCSPWAPGSYRRRRSRLSRCSRSSSGRSSCGSRSGSVQARQRFSVAPSSLRLSAFRHVVTRRRPSGRGPGIGDGVLPNWHQLSSARIAWPRRCLVFSTPS